MLDGVAEGLEGRCDWWFFDYFMVFLRRGGFFCFVLFLCAGSKRGAM